MGIGKDGIDAMRVGDAPTHTVAWYRNSFGCQDGFEKMTKNSTMICMLMYRYNSFENIFLK